MPPSVRRGHPGGSSGSVCRRAASARGQRAGRHARLHRHGQVVRAVLQHRVQAREIEHHVGAIRRAAEPLGAAAAPREDGEPFVVGERQHVRGFLERPGPRHPARLPAVDRGGGAGCRIVGGAVGAQPRAERVAQRAGGDAHTHVPAGNTGRGRPESLAARRVRGQQLAGIHQAVGIEDAPQPIHEVQIGLGELQRQALALVGADAVLAGHAAAERDARLQQFLVGLLGARQLVGIAVVVADQRMQVAVAGVEHVGDEQPVTLGDADELAHDLRQLRARDDRVLQQIRRGQPPHRAGRLLAPLPQQRPLGVVAGDAHRDRAPLPADLRRALAPGSRPRRAGRPARSAARRRRLLESRRPSRR